MNVGTVIDRLENNTAQVEDASLEGWVALAKYLKECPEETNKPWPQMKARIQVLVTDAGLISDSDFVKRTKTKK